MEPQTFTITNTGNVTVELSQIVFNTPTGLIHNANLVNFGGPENFTGSKFTMTNTFLLLNQLKTFTVYHQYVSGSVGMRFGNIVVTSVTGKIATISTFVFVNPATIPVL